MLVKMASTFSNYLVFYKEGYNNFQSLKMRYIQLMKMSEYTVYLFYRTLARPFAYAIVDSVIVMWK